MNNISKYRLKLRKRKLAIISIQIFFIFAFLFLWEFLVNIKLLNVFLVSSPSNIIKLLIFYFKNNLILNHLYISLSEVILGLIFGYFLGFIIATILYLFPILYKIVEPYLTILNALPKTALAPIFIIWAGTNIKGIVVVAISMSLIISIIQIHSYFNLVDEELIKMMKVYDASKLQILFKIIYPSNINNLFAVFKINISMTWVGVIVGEFLVSRGGIGYLIVYGGQVFKLDLVMMGIIILAILTFLMYLIVNVIEYCILKFFQK